MENVVRRSFSLNLTILRCLGLYPKKSHSALYLIYGYVLLICCLLPDPVLSACYYMRSEDLTILDAGFNMFLMVAMISFVPKMIPFIRNNEKIRDCIYCLESTMRFTPNERQRSFLEDCIWVCRRNSTFFLVSTVLDNITWGVRPVFATKRKFPMDVWLPFDATTNTVVYIFTYIFIAMGTLYASLISAAVDPCISGMAYHAAGQINILKDNLEFLTEYAEEQLNESTGVYHRIRLCIQHHHNIICFVRQIEDCFSWVVFSQFLGSTIIICFCCLQLTQLQMGVNFLLMTFYLSSALFQIYLYCYYGTILYEESKTLTTAAYMGKWYEYDLKSQKALSIFMQRANVAMSVTAGNVLDLSLGTFTQLLKRSYSLLAVLENY